MSTKTYYCRTPASRFIFSDGTEAYFSAGRPAVLEVNSTAHQAELDAILGRQSQIYVQTEAELEVAPVVVVPAKSTAEVAKEDATMGIGNARTTQETGNSADAGIQQSFQQATSEADAKLMALRTAAAERLAASQNGKPQSA